MATNENVKTAPNGANGAARDTAREAIAELRFLGTADRLLGLYDLGLDACSVGDAQQISAVLEELINSLDFQYADISEGFHRVYSYCLEQNHNGDLDRVAFVLQDLRETLTRAAAESNRTPLSS